MDVRNSQRLTYRLMTKDDAQDLYDLDNDPEVMRYITQGKTTPMEEVLSVFIPRFEKYTNAEQGWGLWKVNLRESLGTGDFLGWILIRPMGFYSDSPEFDNLEIGWRFKQIAWGKGYATEAAKAVKDALADLALNKNTGVTHLSAIADTDNLGSINIMKKLGMTHVKSYIHESPTGDIPAEYYQTRLL